MREGGQLSWAEGVGVSAHPLGELLSGVGLSQRSPGKAKTVSTSWSLDANCCPGKGRGLG